ncbi:unnamed protein product [Caenorhabditis bovis]|uniref:Uncharacterized protein n=1 Tax=Caenorhabditis bovis TaxID=2654633 RepID=A0A8S1FFK1_9PELO|nr:unnamed protein product [Caenorhabditis bovis]
MANTPSIQAECEEYWAQIDECVERINRTLHNVEDRGDLQSLLDTIFVNFCLEEIEDAKDICRIMEQHDHESPMQLVRDAEERLNNLMNRYAGQN